jgi:hypothetical protein
LFLDHAINSVKSTLLPNNTLSPNEANPPNAKETKIALGDLVTFFMKKRCYNKRHPYMPSDFTGF